MVGGLAYVTNRAGMPALKNRLEQIEAQLKTFMDMQNSSIAALASKPAAQPTAPPQPTIEQRIAETDQCAVRLRRPHPPQHREAADRGEDGHRLAVDQPFDYVLELLGAQHRDKRAESSPAKSWS